MLSSIPEEIEPTAMYVQNDNGGGPMLAMALENSFAERGLLQDVDNPEGGDDVSRDYNREGPSSPNLEEQQKTLAVKALRQSVLGLKPATDIISPLQSQITTPVPHESAKLNSIIVGSSSKIVKMSSLKKDQLPHPVESIDAEKGYWSSDEIVVASVWRRWDFLKR